MRTIHGLNLVAIGQRIGTDPRTVGKWQAGKHKPNKDSRKKINALYREVRKDMTTQNTVNPFEDFFDWSKEVSKKPVAEVITVQQFGEHSFEIYGDKDNPLFIAVEVAKMIEVQNTTDLLKRVDEDEKLTYVVSRAGQKREVNMLTEFGLYEVLFQSRKPKAKEFKRVVKQILKEIRQQGYYMQGELVEPTTAPTEEEAERYYIDALTKLILEATDLSEKERLNQRLGLFLKNRNYYSKRIETSH
ncbi:Bro-N domain-containing protein [Streptococcus danieliae]|uniref:BRO-N domain-containing protein n=1 Tax=Streptococcus danieliae TaxID=747656 RepID=UPI001923CFF1|nr:BRO family protein [Streptococcus danieliae]